MTSPLLPNHLRANRKRLALSQDDVALLLGIRDGTNVCRYERFLHAPDLEAALACEVIFQRPISELFPGLYQKIEKKVAQRAKTLSEGKSTGKVAVRKRNIFTSLANRTFITTP